VPYYPVWGNHEENAPVMKKLFHTPGPGGADVNWAQHIGPVLLIGIDGRPAHRWQNPRWIDRALSGSKAKFIFFVSHYPAYSSGSNGELDEETGEPEDSGYRIARRTLLPRLRKHRATAFVVAHEHCYERSDLPGGLVQICSAGAGAPRTRKQDDEVARRQNPYSKVFAPVLHYSLFEVRGDTCTFTAKTPDGRALDRLTFRARKPQ
jgi:hypothetical protein